MAWLVDRPNWTTLRWKREQDALETLQKKAEKRLTKDLKVDLT